jgi:hypothetical protein
VETTIRDGHLDHLSRRSDDDTTGALRSSPAGRPRGPSGWPVPPRRCAAIVAAAVATLTAGAVTAAGPHSRDIGPEPILRRYVQATLIDHSHHAAAALTCRDSRLDSTERWGRDIAALRQ